MNIKEIRAMKKDITKDQAKKALEMARAGASFRKILEIVLSSEIVKGLYTDLLCRAVDVLFPAAAEARRDYLRTRKDPQRMRRAYKRWQEGETLSHILKEMNISQETFRRWRHEQAFELREQGPSTRRENFHFWSHKIKKRKCLKCGRIFRSDVYHLCPACRRDVSNIHPPVEWRGELIK